MDSNSEVLNTQPPTVRMPIITEHQLEVMHFLCNHGEYCIVSEAAPAADLQLRVQAVKNNMTVDKLVEYGLIEDVSDKVLANVKIPEGSPAARAFSATEEGILLFNDNFSHSKSIQ